MKILTDAAEYINSQAWAEKTVEELGAGAAGKMVEAIQAKIGSCKSRNRHAALVDKLEGLSACLTIAINARRLRDFMAPGIEAVRRVKKHSQAQSNRRQNRRTWKGMTKDQLAARDREIVADYKQTKLTRNHFATKHAADYGLKWRRIMDILTE